MHQNTKDPWMCAMLEGRFEDAWTISDSVLESGLYRSPHLPRHFQSVWDGTPLEGKRVLVRCYHGLGDTIQFIRYVPLLKSIAKEVIVWSQAPLVEILKSVQGIDMLLPLHNGTPEVEYDVDVEILELPYIFRTTLDTIPSKIPYLQVESLLTSINFEQLLVGIVWQAGDWDGKRSVPFEVLTPLFEIKGIQLTILQFDASSAGWEEGFGIHPGVYCLYDYARVIRGMDLLITVDTMSAHMAGAQGVPVWTLLHAEADWRWMENRSDSPWYPTMKLFRQDQAEDWKSLVARVVEQLKKVLETRQFIYPNYEIKTDESSDNNLSV